MTFQEYHTSIKPQIEQVVKYLSKLLLKIPKSLAYDSYIAKAQAGFYFIRIDLNIDNNLLHNLDATHINNRIKILGDIIDGAVYDDFYIERQDNKSITFFRFFFPITEEQLKIIELPVNKELLAFFY